MCILCKWHIYKTTVPQSTSWLIFCLCHFMKPEKDRSLGFTVEATHTHGQFSFKIKVKNLRHIWCHSHDLFSEVKVEISSRPTKRKLK